MSNEKNIAVLILVAAVLFSGCCTRGSIPASIQADIKRLTDDNRRLEAENELFKERINVINTSIKEYTGRVDTIAGESLTGLDKLQRNNLWLGNFIQGLLEQLQVRDNQPGKQIVLGQG